MTLKEILGDDDFLGAFTKDPHKVLEFAWLYGKMECDGTPFPSNVNNMAVLHAKMVSATAKELQEKNETWDAMCRIIMLDKPSHAFTFLDKCEFLDFLIPELSALKGVQRLQGVSHKDNFLHSLEVLDNMCTRSDKLWLRWTALLHDIGKGPTKKFEYHPKPKWTFHGHEVVGSGMVGTILMRLDAFDINRLVDEAKINLPDELNYVRRLVMMHHRPIGKEKDIVTPSAIRRLMVDAGEDLDDLFLLCESDITTKNAERAERRIAAFHAVKERVEEVREIDRLKAWQPPVSGNEIMTAYNLGPGKLVGILKDSLREEILAGRVEETREASIEFLEKKVRTMQMTTVRGKWN